MCVLHSFSCSICLPCVRTRFSGCMNGQPFRSLKMSERRHPTHHFVWMLPTRSADLNSRKQSLPANRNTNWIFMESPSRVTRPPAIFPPAPPASPAKKRRLWSIWAAFANMHNDSCGDCFRAIDAVAASIAITLLDQSRHPRVRCTLRVVCASELMIHRDR